MKKYKTWQSAVILSIIFTTLLLFGGIMTIYYINSRNMRYEEPITDVILLIDEDISTYEQDETEWSESDLHEPVEIDDKLYYSEYDNDYDCTYDYYDGYEIPDTIIINIADFDEELSYALDAIARSYNSVAVSLIFYDGDSVFYAYQFGYADVRRNQPINLDTKMRVASLSKLTVTIVAMILVDEGKLDLYEDISTYLGYEVRNPNFPNVPITSKMLMQHTSSIVDSDPFHSSRAGNSSSSTQHLLGLGTSYRNSEPGSRFEYSNFAMSVLAAVCEMITGKSLDSLSRELLFDSLEIDAGFLPANIQQSENIAAIYNANHNMTRSVDSQTAIGESDDLGHDHHLAQGNLTISALDFARILSMILNSGVYANERILSDEAVQIIHEVIPVSGHFMHGLSVRYHDSAFLDSAVFWHTGSAYGTFAQFIYSRETGRAVVVVTTGANTGRRANDMINICTALSELVWEHDFT